MEPAHVTQGVPRKWLARIGTLATPFSRTGTKPRLKLERSRGQALEVYVSAGLPSLDGLSISRMRRATASDVLVGVDKKACPVQNTSRH
jgi:hypothetical protein